MKAAAIRAFGGIEVVKIEELPAPRAQAGEAVVAVRAAALNHLDIWVRKGRGAPPTGAHILGSDACGVIVEMNGEAGGLNVGDSVVINPGLSCGHCEYCRRGEESECASFGIIGMARPGTFAERVPVPVGNLLPKPPSLTDEEAAALPLAYVTAWRMLFSRGQLRPGESVLIHGIGGGVALAGLQLARLGGAEVIVTSSSEDKLARARGLGAGHAINYRTADVTQEVQRITGGRGVDLVFDNVGAAAWPLDFACVRKGGRIVLCGVTTGADAPTSLRDLYWRQISIHGCTLGSREDFRQMLAAVACNGLKPVMDSVHPLAGIGAAMRRMEEGGQFGKIVLRVG